MTGLTPFLAKRNLKGTFQHSDGTVGTEVTNQSIKDALDAAKKVMRSGVGYRSSIIYCHPSNLKYFRELSKQVQDCASFLHLVKPYRIMANEHVPRTSKFKVGMKYHDTRFVTYSTGPASDMTIDEYDEMCDFMGWGKIQWEEKPVCFEIDSNTFSGAVSAAKSFTFTKDYLADKVNESMELKVLEEMPYDDMLKHCTAPVYPFMKNSY